MLRVTAHNSAGFTVAEYEFATLTVNGGEFIRMHEFFTSSLVPIKLDNL